MSSNLPFERIKQIPGYHQNTVFGYIRQCQLLFKSDRAYYQIHKSIQFSVLLFYFACIDSKVLTDKEIDKLLTMFSEQNKFKELEPYSYEVLYASYNDGIGRDKFVNLCHDQQNLLCVIETKAGNVWGGYTSKGWRSDPEQDGSQGDDEAFLYVIRSKDNYVPRIFDVVKHDQALFTQSNFYCIFGKAPAAYGLNSDGKTGLTTNRKSKGDNYYQGVPHDFYITGEGTFEVANL